MEQFFWSATTPASHSVGNIVRHGELAGKQSVSEIFFLELLLIASNSPHGSVVERVTSNDKVVSSILAVGKRIR